jgi:hypothetical protein
MKIQSQILAVSQIQGKDGPARFSLVADHVWAEEAAANGKMLPSA